MLNPEKQTNSPQRVVFNYIIPNHLRGITDMDQVRAADLSVLDKDLKKSGSALDEKIEQGVIWRMGFPNMVLDAKRIYNKWPQVHIDVVPIHPHRADLAFKKDRAGIKYSPITVNSILRNKERDVVLGIRGGNVKAGKIGIIPGGHAEYNPTNLQDDALYHLSAEFEEELGYKWSSEEREAPIIAVHANRDTNGLNILYNTRTKKTFKEIEETWRMAQDRYEHSGLLKVSFEDIKTLAQTGKLGTKETTPFFQDCLAHYITNR